MKKQILPRHEETRPPDAEGWLDLDSLAELEITSEDSAHPIESALVEGHGGTGWRASEPGRQSIRLRFADPRSIRRIRLVFEEKEHPRTQEFTLRWSPGGGAGEEREILRQQFAFSPTGATQQIEDYTVNLEGVGALELSILPDISGGGFASLAKWQVA